MVEPEEKMITLKEAAAELGIVVATLYRYIAKYKFKTYRKVGDRRSYLRVQDVQSLKGFIPKE